MGVVHRVGAGFAIASGEDPVPGWNCGHRRSVGSGNAEMKGEDMI